MHKGTPKSNFLTIVFVAVTCILIGGLIGAVTNMINGTVSPYYFQAALNWNFQDIWSASVAQGIFEGLIYGVIFSIVFTTGFGIITKGTATYSFAFRILIKITAIVILCWIIGGLIATFLVRISPDFYRSHFPLTPTDQSEMIKFAWVGGSIWGGMIGAFLSTFMSIILMKNGWLKNSQQK